MNLIESFRIAWQSLLAHKMRALLTMLGIIIGVGTVVGMLAIGNGYAAFIQQEFNKLGVGIFYVTPTARYSATDKPQTPQLTAEDVDALMIPGAAPLVIGAAVEYSSQAIASAGGERYFYGVKGVSGSFFTITTNDIGAGRVFTAEEDRAQMRLAVVGQKVAATLFGGIANAVGKRITLNGVSFEVIGVTVTKANQAAGAIGRFGDPGEQVLIPYNTAVKRLFRNQITPRINVTSVTLKAPSAALVEDASKQVRAVLRDRHRLSYQNDDFTTRNPAQLAEQVAVMTVGFSAFLGIIGGISLLVGGIGIMNIMLVSVTQRTREIGLRKAVGARRRDILWQFLIEAIVLCLLGGLLGIVLGFGLAQLGNLLFTLVFKVEARAQVTTGSLILATSIATGVGLFFGIYPAFRASRLDPIRALRYE